MENELSGTDSDDIDIQNEIEYLKQNFQKENEKFEEESEEKQAVEEKNVSKSVQGIKELLGNVYK